MWHTWRVSSLFSEYSLLILVTRYILCSPWGVRRVSPLSGSAIIRGLRFSRSQPCSRDFLWVVLFIILIKIDTCESLLIKSINTGDIHRRSNLLLIAIFWSSKVTNDQGATWYLHFVCGLCLHHYWNQAWSYFILTWRYLKLVGPYFKETCKLHNSFEKPSFKKQKATSWQLTKHGGVELRSPKTKRKSG